jgi:crossover junction endodeoxyribonuclease RuvC
VKVLGIDPSLTGSAVATAHDSARIPTPDSWPILRRMRVVRSRIERAAMDADVIVIEGPAFNAKFGKPHERAGLWWLLVERLEAVTTAGIAVLPIQSLKIYATSDGGADKAKVAQAARWHFGDRIASDDEADATWCAAAGHAALGQPLVQLGPEHTRGLASLTWIRDYDAPAARLRYAAQALGGAR